VNVAIGVVVGAIPITQNVFDVFWKANRRKYRVLCRHVQQPRKHSWRDWVFLAVIVTALALAFSTPAVRLAVHWIVLRQIE
jgi:hypothetical protein